MWHVNVSVILVFYDFQIGPGHMIYCVYTLFIYSDDIFIQVLFLYHHCYYLFHLALSFVHFHVAEIHTWNILLLGLYTR